NSSPRVCVRERCSRIVDPLSLRARASWFGLSVHIVLELVGALAHALSPHCSARPPVPASCPLLSGSQFFPKTCIASSLSTWGDISSRNANAVVLYSLLQLPARLFGR